MPKSSALRFILFYFMALTLVGCSSTRRLEKKERRMVYAKLGLEEGRKDNFALYKEVSLWLNTPHVDGGISRSGVDCSGLVYMVYKNVYGTMLERNSGNMLKKNCRKIRMSRLKEGDLVFFNTAGKGKASVNHVGIYLKDKKFVHTSTSRGVIVSCLKEDYFDRTWVCGGRVK